MPDHIQHPFYPHSFLKDFSVATPKPAVENNSFNSSVNIFLFSDCLFNNYNRNSGAFLFSERAQHTNVVSFLLSIKTRSIVKGTRTITSIKFEDLNNNHKTNGKKKRKHMSVRATASSSASLSKRKEVVFI